MRARALYAAAALGALLAAGGAARAQTPGLVYDAVFEATLVPSERLARVQIQLSDPQRLLRELEFRTDAGRHLRFSGDGEVEVKDASVRWVPPPTGGVLRYDFAIDQLRDATSYDARCTSQWAVFRGDDLVPPARVRALAGAHSRSILRLRLPDGWRAATRFDPVGGGGDYQLDDPRRLFDRPTGWIAAGARMGIVRERVAGSRVAIAGPAGQGLRRLDMLALLRWTLPELRKVLGELPPRVLIVGAGDPMYRGGLSGPHSLFLHARRPLMTPDVSSPLLHELVHATLRIRPATGGDWIVEGLAEYYSLELLRRSRTVSAHRIERAYARLAERGGSVPERGEHATRRNVARAVTVLRGLDGAIREATTGEQGLDHVVRALAHQGGAVATADFQALAEQIAGRSLARFFARELTPLPATAASQGRLSRGKAALPARQRFALP